jgi:signal peptidase I
MVPTLRNLDRVAITNLFFTPKNGDIIIIKTDTFGDIPIVKRVIAVGGQQVDIHFDTHEVIVDGVVQYEPYISEPTERALNFEGPVDVPEGYLFVMGDNRNESLDSRSSLVGMVDTRNVIGKVLMILLPGKDAYGLRSWNRIGSVY